MAFCKSPATNHINQLVWMIAAGSENKWIGEVWSLQNPSRQNHMMSLSFFQKTYREVRLDLTGRLRLFLQCSLFRKYLNYSTLAIKHSRESCMAPLDFPCVGGDFLSTQKYKRVFIYADSQNCRVFKVGWPSPIWRVNRPDRTYETPILHVDASQVMSPAFRFHPMTCKRASPAVHWKQRMLGGRETWWCLYRSREIWRNEDEG